MEASNVPIEKTPGEKWSVDLDFAGKLRSALVTLSSVACVAKDVTEDKEVTATSTVLQGTPASVSGTVLTINLAAGGQDGHDYLIQALVTCSDGSILEEVIPLKVRERYNRDTFI